MVLSVRKRFVQKAIKSHNKGCECGARSRNRTGTAVKPQDFKSCVSTNFTTRAVCDLSTHNDAKVSHKKRQLYTKHW